MYFRVNRKNYLSVKELQQLVVMDMVDISKDALFSWALSILDCNEKEEQTGMS